MKKPPYLTRLLLTLPVVILALYLHGDPLLITIGTWLLLGICIVVNAFVGVYSFRDWKATEGGRAIMYTMVSFAALADLSLMTNFLGNDWPWRGALRLVLFWGIFLTITHLLNVLVMSPSRARRVTRETDRLREEERWISQ
jgi:hypothetical protein